MGLFGVVEEIRHKNGEFPYGALQVSDTPLPRQGVAALNATHPDSGTSNGLGSYLLRGGVYAYRLLRRATRREEGRRFSRNRSPVRVSRSSALIFLYSASRGHRHFLTLDAGMGFPPLVHPASSRFAGPEL